jgi:hypothetical protein
MNYTIYKITNKINEMIYIGKHQTKNLDDGYMGSGKFLLQSIAEHGIVNFHKDILFVFDNEAEMNAKERELVNIKFVKETTNYNLCIGGGGGWSFVNRKGLGGFGGREHSDDSKVKIGLASAGREVLTDARNKISANNEITNVSRGRKTSAALKGRPKTKEHKTNISKALTGKSRAVKPKFTWTICVDGNEVVVNNLTQFCKEHGINSARLVNNKYVDRGYKILNKVTMRA